MCDANNTGLYQPLAGQTSCTVLCEPGRYQPHFQRTACFSYSRGQSTNRSGTTAASECFCQEGFE